MRQGDEVTSKGKWTGDPSGGVKAPEALILPDPADAVTHLWAEGSDADAAQLLLDEWAAVVERAGR